MDKPVLALVMAERSEPFSTLGGRPSMIFGLDPKHYTPPKVSLNNSVIVIILVAVVHAISLFRLLDGEVSNAGH